MGRASDEEEGARGGDRQTTDQCDYGEKQRTRSRLRKREECSIGTTAPSKVGAERGA